LIAISPCDVSDEIPRARSGSNEDKPFSGGHEILGKAFEQTPIARASHERSRASVERTAGVDPLNSFDQAESARSSQRPED
jgi:hypothetical protein